MIIIFFAAVVRRRSRFARADCRGGGTAARRGTRIVAIQIGGLDTVATMAQQTDRSAAFGGQRRAVVVVRVWRLLVGLVVGRRIVVVLHIGGRYCGRVMVLGVMGQR